MPELKGIRMMTGVHFGHETVSSCHRHPHLSDLVLGSRAAHVLGQISTSDHGRQRSDGSGIPEQGAGLYLFSQMLISLLYFAVSVTSQNTREGF